MRMLKITALLFAIPIIFIGGCSTESEQVYPGQPAFAEGTTDSNGEVELDFESHLITITAEDFIPQPVSGIDIKGYLFKDYLYIFAVGDDTWYSNHKLIPYSEFSGNDGDIVYSAGKPTSPQEVVGDVTITLERITREVYSYSEDPDSQETLLTDDWATVTSHTGTTSDMWDLVSEIAQDGNIIINTTSSVSSQTNATINTIAMVLDSSVVNSDTVFSVLLGLEFYIFDSDTLTFSTVALEDSVLPVIFINDATLGEGNFFCQFTLTWGEVPQDLDSHLWTPQISGSSYHIYYANPGLITSAPYAFLDVDDVTSWGPEHVVIEQAFPGTYYYSVYHFSGDGNIPTSGCKVTLLKPDRTVEEFEPPNAVDTGEGWYWHVCTIDGTTGTVTEIGTMNQNPPVTLSAPVQMPDKPIH